MSSQPQLYTCTPRQARKFVEDIMYAGLVPFLQSSPGLGKSSIIRNVASALNLKLIDHRLSTSAPEDLSGLPQFYNTEHGPRARFTPFADLFPLEGDELPQGKQGWMLFLDEFNSAQKDVQAAAYKLILDRQVGQYNLHEKVLVCAAGNLATDRAITNPLSTAMQSRVVHLHMRVDFEEWLQDVAFKEDYDPRIIGFLSQFPSKLMDFQPNHQDKTFNCPRTWEFVNRLVKGQKAVNEMAIMLAGTISSGSAADFVQFCKIYEQVVNIKQVLADPFGCPVPEAPGMRWATVTHLMDVMKPEDFEKVSDYIDRFDVSFRILFYRSVLVRKPEMRREKAMIKAMSQLGKHLAG